MALTKLVHGLVVACISTSVVAALIVFLLFLEADSRLLGSRLGWLGLSLAFLLFAGRLTMNLADLLGSGARLIQLTVGGVAALLFPLSVWGIARGVPDAETPLEEAEA